MRKPKWWQKFAPDEHLMAVTTQDADDMALGRRVRVGETMSEGLGGEDITFDITLGLHRCPHGFEMTPEIMQHGVDWDLVRANHAMIAPTESISQ